MRYGSDRADGVFETAAVNPATSQNLHYRPGNCGKSWYLQASKNGPRTKLGRRGG